MVLKQAQLPTRGVLPLFQIVPPVEGHPQTQGVYRVQVHRRGPGRIRDGLPIGKVHSGKQLEDHLRALVAGKCAIRAVLEDRKV